MDAALSSAGLRHSARLMLMLLPYQVPIESLLVHQRLVSAHLEFKKKN